MFFVFTNVLITFQLYINKCLAEKLDIFIIVYLDNIFIYLNEIYTKDKDAVRLVL